MRTPIKLSNAVWPDYLKQFIGGNLRQDPRILLRSDWPSDQTKRISAAISAFKFGTTFKTTCDKRHAEADAILIADGVQKEDVILDIGASDGITSLNLINKLKLNFACFFITDYNLNVWAVRRGRCIFFFDKNRQCILIANPFFVAYPVESGLVRRLFRKSTARAERQLDTQGKRLQLIHPAVLDQKKKDAHIVIGPHNIFQPWKGLQPTIIKVANVLNRNYFSDSQIQRALRTLHATLPEGGRLFVVENRKQLQVGLFVRTAKNFQWKAGIHRTDIHDLIAEPLPSIMQKA